MKNKKVEYGKYGYIFIAPFFIVFAIFQLYPLLYTVVLSTMNMYTRPGGIVVEEFKGLANYLGTLIEVDNKFKVVEGAKLFNTQMVRALGNTIIMWVCNFIPQVLLALLLASWFTDTAIKLKGQGAFKIMIFMPNIITASSIAVLFYSLFSRYGPITTLLRDLGWITQDYNYLEHAGATRGFISFMLFWMWYGNTMIVLIAGILGINPSLYEAATVDGASGKQSFAYITLPLLMPIIQFTLVTSAVGGLQMYDIPALFNISGSGEALPNGASQTITMYIRDIGMRNQNLGKAGAAAMMLFIVTLIISLLFFALTKDKETKKKHAVIK